MKRIVFIALLGVAAGTAAHLGFYAFRRPIVETQLTRDLAWMKTEFQLDDTQYTRLRALHARTGPELERLFSVLRTTREELVRLEELRRSTDKVDFIVYHETAETNRQARRQCRALTLDLIYSVAEVMRPEQRELYFRLVGSGVELGPPPSS